LLRRLSLDTARGVGVTSGMSDDMNRARQAAIEAAVDDIRRIEADVGVTREGVGQIRDRLIEMASQKDLFSLDVYPAPETESNMYRISEDDDGRFALYVQASHGERSTPAHNHTTWAVIVGFEGQELNRFYDRVDDGPPQQNGEHMVEAGTGVAMLPDDVHSIHLSGRSLNFHMYGLGLERVDTREYYSHSSDSWKRFRGINSIREARPGLRTS